MLGKVESENLLNSIKSQKLSKRTTFTEETLNMAIEIRKTSENKKVFMGSLYFTGNNARDRELQIFIDEKEGTFEFIAWQEKTLLNYQGHPYV